MRVRLMGLGCTFASGLVLSLLLLWPRPGMAVEGIFQGKVIDPPVDERVPPGWIFVQGRNHLLRRVEVAHAVIVFSQQVPPNQRRKCGVECLEPGQEIRVTADQDASGEWRATRVEILRLTTNRALRTVAGGSFLSPAHSAPGQIIRLFEFTRRFANSRSLLQVASFTKLNPVLDRAAG
jgi:hypothetical protein